MCGINGIYNIRKVDHPVDLIKKMNQRSAHRGPDYSGVYSDEDIVLGHNRLSIIDLDEVSNQPMISENDNLVLVFNGEIYNYQELRKILEKRHTFKTNGDTEVVLAAFERWGPACLNHFNGMFGLAIWDKNKRELFVARDRLGIKPVYYYDNLEQFAFSSEIRSLLELPFVEKEINEDALVDYLRYGTVHAPRTIINGVRMLMPGHYVLLNVDGIKTHQYWNVNLHYSSESFNQSYDQVKSRTKELFYESVERRLVADVPFGAFLSGGIDSSAVVGVMSEVSKNKVNTFSVTFAEEEFSEAKYARIIAEKFNTNHHEIKLSPTDFLEDLPNAIDSMDHPSMDGPNSYVVSKATKGAGITMALSGLGGDELFAGYDIFKRAYSLLDKKWLMSFPLFFRKGLGTALKVVKPGISSDKIKKTITSKYLELPYYYPINREVLDDNKLHEILSFHNYPENAVHEILQHSIGVGTSGASVPFLSRVTFAEINTYMQNVLLRDTDQMSMAHALEVRVPFLDHKLLEYVYGVRDDFKYPTQPKKLLVDALGDLLPSEIVDRPKMGFTFPWESWLKNDLKDYCIEGFDYLKGLSYFNERGLDNLWIDFLNGKRTITWSRVWTFVVLGHWLKKNRISG
ncbi:asparagine synthase (glutamine-hydrolyzing) [Parvicella tangerina]|uniref:asparagine synthase (glutamine-hydrolyzing) n=1 Tax=Parvicella tangerina TaxID=2829795 RepID=A0A916NSE0_9FLAO|nr:asparagine synthase (glutamine-hydrolyzing) [Parvicella tangerina]CAG5083598.1 Asparagine synthetase [glutamine-hydrolyzing] 1 [Parvicella tangerina]